MELENKKKLGKNFIYNFINQILSLLIPLITSPYIARILKESGNGQYSYSLSIITFFILFATLGFDIYGQKQIAVVQDNIEEKRKIFWEITIIKSVLTLISLGVLYLILFTSGFGEKYNFLILILSIQVISVPFDVQFLFKGEEKFKVIALRTIFIRLAILVCIFSFVKTENDTWIYALCISLATFIPNFIMSISILGKLRIPKFSELRFKKHIKPAILIFIPTLAVTIYSVFDKTMIGFLSENSDYENGCYEHAYKLNSIMTFMTTILSTVLVSRNANDYGKYGIDGIKQSLYFSSNFVWFMSLPLIVGNFVLARNLCSWYLGDGYIIVPELTWIMSIRFLTSGFTEVFGSQLFIVIGKEKYPLVAAICAAILNVSLNFLFIPIFGSIGAAITTAISESSIMLILAFFVIRGKYLSVKKVLLMSWKYIISAAVMFPAVYFLNECFEYSWWSFIIVTITGMLVYFTCLLILRDSFIKLLFNGLKNIFRKKMTEEQ